MTRITRTTPTDRDAINLARPAFVFALALLLANDLVLKATYPGWVTGKLSDFAGLFVLPYFLAWLWPSRRLALHVGVALAFVAWKLPMSRPFVELWNAAPWFDIARVEDLTDLIALASVVLAYRATTHATRRVVHLRSVVLATVALIAFTATSKSRFSEPVRGDYLFSGSPDQLVARLRDRDIDVSAQGEAWELYWSNAFSPCADDIRLRARVVDFGSTSLLRLEQVDSECEPGAEVRAHVVPEINRQLLGLGMRPGKPVPPRDSIDPEVVCTEEDMARAREKGWLNCLRVE